MVNKLRGEIAVDLDKPRVWRLSLRARERIEQLVCTNGATFDSWWTTMKDWKSRDWGILLWAGIARAEEELTIDQVMDLVTDEDLQNFRLEMTKLSMQKLDKLPEELKKKFLEQTGLGNNLEIVLGMLRDSTASQSSSTG